jgi:hypothetical protein
MTPPLTEAEIAELEGHSMRLPYPFRQNYHRLEAVYRPEWKGIVEEKRGTWFEFGELRMMGALDAQSVCAILNAAPQLVNSARRVAELERELAAIREWYERDGSVGGLAVLMERTDGGGEGER